MHEELAVVCSIVSSMTLTSSLLHQESIRLGIIFRKWLPCPLLKNFACMEKKSIFRTAFCCETGQPRSELSSHQRTPNNTPMPYGRYRTTAQTHKKMMKKRIRNQAATERRCEKRNIARNTQRTLKNTPGAKAQDLNGKPEMTKFRLQKMIILATMNTR